MEEGADPNPICPTHRLADSLGVSMEILHNPYDILEYGIRVPCMPNNDPLENILDPHERQNLLLYIRKQSLPHPALMWREAVKREKYLEGMNELRDWFYKNMKGVVNHRLGRGPGTTERCSMCGSSFFGFPLVDHSVSDCGFKLIPFPFRLDFVIANTLAMCGYCNSRSVLHTECMAEGDKLVCDQCKIPGHKRYHGVCYTPYGASPEAFQQRVHDLRVERGERIRQLAMAGYLGFPLPNDWIPNAVLVEVREKEEEGTPIRGCGMLRGREAERYGVINRNHYRYKVFPGLVYVENTPREQLNQPVTLLEAEVNWFILLEQRAREMFRTRDNRLYPCLQYLLSFNVPNPVYPLGTVNAPVGQWRDGIVPPARLRQQNIRPANANVGGAPRINGPQLNANRPAEVAPIENNVDGEARALVDQGIQVNPVEEQPNGEAASDKGVAPVAKNEGRMGVEIATPELVKMCIENARLGLEMNKNFTIHLDCSASEKPFRERFEGIITSHKDDELGREAGLRDLVIEVVKYCIVTLPDEVFSTNVDREVVEALVRVEVPKGYEALAIRITTWQYILSGTIETVMERIPLERLIQYNNFLLNIAQALGGHKRCFIKLSPYPGPYTENSIKMIPTVYHFDGPCVREEMDKWLADNSDSFAVFNLQSNEFPYCDPGKRHSTDRNTEMQERELDSQLKSVLNAIEGFRPRTMAKKGFPHTDALMVIIAYATPCYRGYLESCVAIFQTVLVGHEEQLFVPEQKGVVLLSEYVDLLKLIAKTLRYATTSRCGKRTAILLSNCMKDITFSAPTSLIVVIPSFDLFKSELYAWWLVWINKLFVPLIERIITLDCTCPDHKSVQD